MNIHLPQTEEARAEVSFEGGAFEKYKNCLTMDLLICYFLPWQITMKPPFWGIFVLLFSSIEQANQSSLGCLCGREDLSSPCIAGSERFGATPRFRSAHLR